MNPSALLRSTTEEMANHASVNMELWQRHSIAALRAADRIEALEGEMQRMLEKLERFADEHPDPGPDCFASIYCAHQLLIERTISK